MKKSILYISAILKRSLQNFTTILPQTNFCREISLNAKFTAKKKSLKIWRNLHYIFLQFRREVCKILLQFCHKLVLSAKFHYILMVCRKIFLWKENNRTPLPKQDQERSKKPNSIIQTRSWTKIEDKTFFLFGKIWKDIIKREWIFSNQPSPYECKRKTVIYLKTKTSNLWTSSWRWGTFVIFVQGPLGWIHLRILRGCCRFWKQWKVGKKD